MKRAAWIAGGLLAALLLGAVLWLGPGAIGWSLKARVADADAPWRHVSPDATVLIVSWPQELFASPVAKKLRPELVALMEKNGVKLEYVEEHVELTVTCLDGEGRLVTVASRSPWSPELLARFGEKWSSVDVPSPESGGSLTGATDGDHFLAPLSPGVVLASRLDDAQWAAAQAAGRDEPDVRLPLEDGVALRGEATSGKVLDDLVGKGLPRGMSLSSDVKRLEARITSTEAVQLDLALWHDDVKAARRTATGLAQLRSTLQMVRKGGFGSVLAARLGGAGALLELPDFEVETKDTTVHVSMEFGEAKLREWLQRGIDA